MLKLIITGVGGQGIITAGIILAEAAVLEEHRHATQTQSYGAEARGGLTRTDVIIDESEIIYPLIEQAHVLAVLHQKGHNAYSGTLRPGGTLIHDEATVRIDEKTDARRITLPILTGGRGANIRLLGIICGLTNIVGADSIRRTLRRRYGDDSENLPEFDTGLRIVAERGLANLTAGYAK